MAFSEDDIAICNQALALNGIAAIVTEGDATTQARLCATEYEPARKALLASHAWGFATVTTALDPDDALEHSTPEFAYSFALPELNLRLLAVVDTAKPRHSLPFTIELFIGDDETSTPVLLTNEEEPTIRYIVDAAAPYPPLFHQALVMTLAHRFATLRAKPEVAREFERYAAQAKHEAMLADSSEQCSTQAGLRRI